MSTPHTTSNSQLVKRTRGRPNAQRPARISTRISQTAFDHLQTIRSQQPGTLAATLEKLILQFPIENNKEKNNLNQHS